MRVFLSDGFVSAVQDRNDPGRLCVRARRAAHLRALLPDARVIRTPKADYAFRSFVQRKVFSDALVRRLGEIAYTNFKDSVTDHALHEMYLDVWQAGYDYQAQQR